MIRYLREHAVSLLALFVALGGTTYAATGFPANVIGTKQLKNNAVTKPKLKNNAVTGAKVANDSLTGADVLESTLGQIGSAGRVDRATTATDAATATSATNASNAANAATAVNAATAANAERLAGAPPTTFQRRAIGACSGNYVILIGSAGEVVCGSPQFIDRFDLNSGDIASLSTSLYGLGFTCNSGTTKFTFANGTRGSATLNWFYSNGASIFATGTVLGASPPNTQDFDFDDKRIEGQFILATGDIVTTVKLHAWDGNAAGCEIRFVINSASSA